MKKMILSLILPLTALMAIDFTMTKEGLFADTTTQSPATVTSGEASNNPYLEPVNLPKCDANNPEVQFIRSNADWSTINSSSKRIFCVSPGNYTGLGVSGSGGSWISSTKITRSGTPDKKRYILLNNGNDIHPGKLTKDQLANYTLNMEGASYWVVDRAASFDVGFTHSFLLNKNSTHNIFNRMFTANLYHTMGIKDKAHYNTIQNSRFDGVSVAGSGSDLGTVHLEDWESVTTVLGTKVINNEFVGVVALKLARKVYQNDANYAGTIFDSNDVYFGESIRTDCQGNLDINGNCQAAESAVGIKAGSYDESSPVLITNNHIWGYRPADGNWGTLGGGTGSGLVAYIGAKYIHIKNNVIFDGTNGVIIADRDDKERGTWGCRIENNILYELGRRIGATGGTGGAAPLALSMAEDMYVSKNIIINPIGHPAKVYYNFYNNYFGNNTIINPDEDILHKSNHSEIIGLNTNKMYSTAEEAGYTKDYIFTTDIFTNSPRIVKLKNALYSK